MSQYRFVVPLVSLLIPACLDAPPVDDGELPAPVRARTLEERASETAAGLGLAASAHDLVVEPARAGLAGGTHNRVEVYHDGVRVAGAGFMLHTSGDGEALAPTTVPVGDLEGVDTTPSVTAEDALARVRDDLGETAELVGDAELILKPVVERVQVEGSRGDNAADFVRTVTGYDLVYQLELECGDTCAYRYWIDARTGALVDRASLTSHSTIPGYAVMYPNPVPIDVTPFYEDPDETDPSYKMIDPVRGIQTQGDGVFTISLESEWGATDDRRPEVDVHYNASIAWDLLYNVFGRHGFDGVGAPITYDLIVINDPDHQDAQAKKSNRVNIAASTSDLSRTLLIRDIIAHESAHLFFYSEVGEFAEWEETAALNEATADIFAVLSGFWATHLDSPPGTTDASTIPDTGSDWLMNLEGTTTFRDVCNPANDHAHKNPLGFWMSAPMVYDPASFSPTVEQPHTNGGPIRRMFCMLSRGIEPMGSSAEPWRESDVVPAGSGPVGNTIAAKLWYQALVFNLSPDSHPTFLDARNATLQAAEQLYGKFSPEYKHVQNVFAAVGVGAAADNDGPAIQQWVWGQRGNIVLGATIEDPSSIANVTFELDGVDMGGVEENPPYYSRLFDSNRIADGNHMFRVKATDAENNQATKQQSFLVDNTPPTISQVVLLSDTSEKTYRVEVRAQDNIALNGVTMWMNGQQVAEDDTAPYEFSIDELALADGTYQPTFYAFDSASNSASKNGPLLTVDNTKPVVSYLGHTWDPDQHTLDAWVTFSEAHSTKIEWTLDGAWFDSAWLGPVPNGITINTSTMTSLYGTRTLCAIIDDSYGNEKSYCIPVVLDAPYTPPVPPTTFYEPELGNMYANDYYSGYSPDVVGSSITKIVGERDHTWLFWEVQGGASYSGDSDWYAVTVPAGQTIQVSTYLPCGGQGVVLLFYNKDDYGWYDRVPGYGTVNLDRTTPDSKDHTWYVEVVEANTCNRTYELYLNRQTSLKSGDGGIGGGGKIGSR